MSKLADLQSQHLHLLSFVEGLRFPDVDAESLAHDLRAAQTEAARVDDLRAQLDEARTKLDDAEQRLEDRQRRALAYLRVYAEGNPAMQAQLAQLGVEPSVEVAPKKRGRPKKSEVLELVVVGPELPQ